MTTLHKLGGVCECLTILLISSVLLITGRPSRSYKIRPRHERLRVISAASHLTQEGCQYLLASAAHNEIDLHLIGYKDRAIENALMESSKTSIKLTAAYQLAQTLPEDNLIMLVDAFDVVIQACHLPDDSRSAEEQLRSISQSERVLCQGSVSDILAEYESLGRPGILFSAEANCWPPMLETEGYCELARVYSNATSIYLNSGGVIGRAGELAALWKTLIEQEKAYFRKFSSKGQYWDDQGTVALSYLIGNPYNITLDVMSKIFLSVNDAMPLFGVDGKIGFENEQGPAIMHFNGYAKAALWKQQDWFKKHMSMHDMSHLSFRVNSASKRQTWSELCGAFEIEHSNSTLGADANGS